MSDQPSPEPGLPDANKASAILPGSESRRPLAGLLERSAFEIFPVPSIDRRLDAFSQNTHVTVTCSPTRGIAETLALTEKLRSRGFRVTPHISARLVRDDDHLQEIVEHLASLEVVNLFVIGGDVKQPAGKFPSTLSLLAALSNIGRPFESVGVGGYPEGHPFLKDHSLIEALKAKEAFASYVVTQMCFDPGAIVSWIEDIRKHDIRLPVHIGLPGAIPARKLLRFAMKIGVGDSARFLTKHSNLVMRLAKSRYRPDDLVNGLARRLGESGLEIGGFHLYTFNEVASTEAWRSELVQHLEANQAADMQPKRVKPFDKGERHADPL